MNRRNIALIKYLAIFSKINSDWFKLFLEKIAEAFHATDP
jgi:hypothetical protein